MAGDSKRDFSFVESEGLTMKVDDTEWTDSRFGHFTTE
jgi:hypothetical protein